MDYKEIKTKKGRTLVFCDLKELLMEYYEVKSEEELVRYQVQNKEGWVYNIHCPFCKAEGHTKHKLGIQGDYSYGHCFVCDRLFMGINNEIDLKFDLPNFSYGLKPDFKVVPLTDSVWNLDKYEYECEDYDETGYNYLVGRHKYMADLYKTLGFRFLDGNIVMPFVYNNEVIYYQIRFSDPGARIRYYFPPITSKPPYIIGREGEARHRIMIVEGIFDAIAVLIQCPDYTPVAVLGSSISDYQMDFIRDYAGYVNEVRIWMDETKISQRIADRIKSEIDYAPISIIRSNGEDPEECMVRKMKERPGSEIGWIKPKKQDDKLVFA